MYGRMMDTLLFFGQVLIFNHFIQACPTELDVVFIVDGSRKTSPSQYVKLLDFSWRIIQTLHTRSNTTQVGVIINGEDIAKPVQLTETLETLSNIKQIRQPGGQSKPFIGLLNARGLFRVRLRKDATKMVLFVTGGQDNVTEHATEQVNRAQQEGITIISLLFGPWNYHTDKFKKSVFGTGNLYSYNDVNNLLESVNSIYGKICSVLVARPLPKTPSPTAQIASYGPCLGFTMSENLGYKRHPSDCSKLIQCDPQKYGEPTTVEACPFGEFWDQDKLACRAVELVDCPMDLCKLKLLSTFTTQRTCSSYYECQNGRSVLKCCPLGKAFIPGVGCRNDRTCRTLCTLTEAPFKGSCQKRSVYGQSQIYKQYLQKGYWMEKICEKGRFYNQSSCECALISRAPSSAHHDCRPKLYLPFCNGIRDHSGFNTNVINEADQVAFRDGKAYFNGRGKLTIPVFTNKDLGGTVIVKLKYKIMRDDDLEEFQDTSNMDDIENMYDNDDYEDDRLMTLWSNGHCYKRGPCQEEPSIVMATNRASSALQITTVQNRSSVLRLEKVPSDFDYNFDMEFKSDVEGYTEERFEDVYNYLNPDLSKCKNDSWGRGWRTALFLMNRNRISFYDDDLNVWKSMGSGSFKKTYFGLHFGQGYGLAGFRGYMDEVYVYLCRPEDNKLFDGVKINYHDLQHPINQSLKTEDSSDTNQAKENPDKGLKPVVASHDQNNQQKHPSTEPGLKRYLLSSAHTQNTNLGATTSIFKDKTSGERPKYDSFTESEMTTESHKNSYNDKIQNDRTTEMYGGKTILSKIISSNGIHPTSISLGNSPETSFSNRVTVSDDRKLQTSLNKINTLRPSTTTLSVNDASMKLDLIAKTEIKETIKNNQPISSSGLYDAEGPTTYTNNEVDNMEYTEETYSNYKQTTHSPISTTSDSPFLTALTNSALSIDTKDSPHSTDTTDIPLSKKVTDSPLLTETTDSSLSTDTTDSSISTETTDSPFSTDTTHSPLPTDLRNNLLSTTANIEVSESSSKIINVIRAKIHFRLKTREDYDDDEFYYDDFDDDDYDNDECYDYKEDYDGKSEDNNHGSHEEEDYDKMDISTSGYDTQFKQGIPEISFEKKSTTTSYSSVVKGQYDSPYNETATNPSQLSAHITNHTLTSAAGVKSDNASVPQTKLDIGKETLKLSSKVKERLDETSGITSESVNFPLSNLDKNKLHNIFETKTTIARISHGNKFNKDTESRKAIDVTVDKNNYAKTTESINLSTYQMGHTESDHSSNVGVEQGTSVRKTTQKQTQT